MTHSPGTIYVEKGKEANKGVPHLQSDPKPRISDRLQIKEAVTLTSATPPVIGCVERK